MLDDEGCLNAFLPMDLFLLTATPLSMGMRFRVYDSTLGIAVINGNFPCYWVVGIPYCLILNGFFKCSTSIPCIHTCYNVLGTLGIIFIKGGFPHIC